MLIIRSSLGFVIHLFHPLLMSLATLMMKIKAQRIRDDGGMAKEWSADPLEIPRGPITRARAKRFKEALNVLIQDSQAEGAHGLNSKKETKLVHVIKVNPNFDQELRRF